MLSKVSSVPQFQRADQIESFPAGIRKEVGTYKDYEGLDKNEVVLQTRRGPHLAPTTEMGRNHGTIELELANRESKKIGMNESLTDIEFEKKRIISHLNNPL